MPAWPPRWGKGEKSLTSTFLMAATHSPWTPAEVADALAAAAKHTAMRGEKLVVHWKDVADELSAKGGFRSASRPPPRSHNRAPPHPPPFLTPSTAASAIQHHFAGVDIPGGLAAGPHARYGDDENHVLLDLMNTPAFMYTRGTRVCHKWCVFASSPLSPPRARAPAISHPSLPPPRATRRAQG